MHPPSRTTHGESLKWIAERSCQEKMDKNSAGKDHDLLDSNSLRNLGKARDLSI